MFATLLMTCALSHSPADDAAVALALAKAKREREAKKADPSPAAPTTPAGAPPVAAVTQTATEHVVTIDGTEYRVPLSHDGYPISKETAVAKVRETHAERTAAKASPAACRCGPGCGCAAGECGGVGCPTGAAKATAAPVQKFRTEYRQVTRYVRQCNNGTCTLVPQTVVEAVQVPE